MVKYLGTRTRCQGPTHTAPSTWQTLALVVRTMQVLCAPMLVPAKWLARGTAAVRGIRWQVQQKNLGSATRPMP